MRKHWVRWLVGAIVLIALVVTVGPFVYIHFIEPNPPAKLDLSTAPTPTTSASANKSNDSSPGGTWKVTSGSQAGYRVNEVLFGQDNTAVGRTPDVTGTMTIEGTNVTAATMTADLTSVTSDQSRRDAQFQGRIMDTAEFPNATFKLTQPITLGSDPPDGKTITVSGTGELTLHGTTKTVTVPLEARRTANTIQVSGSIPVKFSDYGIDDPSFGTVSVQDHGTIEFLLNFVSANS